MPLARSFESEVAVLLFGAPEAIDLTDRVDELDDREKARLLALRRPADRRRFLVAHIGLRDALALRLDMTPAEVRLGNDTCPVCGSAEHGRPISLDDPDSTHWSISHTDGLVAIAVGSSPVGIDVESLARADDTSFLDEVGTHPDDADAMVAVPSADERALGRTRLARWSRLEAALKVDRGGPGNRPLHDRGRTLGPTHHPPTDAEFRRVPTPVGDDRGPGRGRSPRRCTCRQRA
ncbi:MAG: hypothetical protein V9E94_09220 [Microthrixaceae bacterium]